MKDFLKASFKTD
jgi:hypothetical protein